MLSDFEAYLLKMMRGTSHVTATLRGLGVTPEECADQARRAVARWGVRRPGYNADIYRDAVGDAVSEELLHAGETVPEFVGSVRRRYTLPLWPKVLFEVNQHPSGYAWGERFVPGPTAHAFDDPSAVEPWEWTVRAIESAAAHVEILDYWDQTKDLRVEIERGGVRHSYLAVFDFDLLQEWRRT